MYLLDTNACIRILNGTSQALIERLRATPPSRIRLCSIVKAELQYGARHSAQVAKNLRLLEDFFGPFVCLPFDDRCADHYGVIRAELSRLGLPIGPNDLLIASTAVAHDLVLVSHNAEEFSRVVGLQLEDWEAA